MPTTSTRDTATLELAVTGMTCGHCKQRVESALAGVAGVRAASADPAAGRATVTYDASAATPESLAEAVREAGYGAEVVPAAPGGTPSSAYGCATHA